MRVQFLKNLCWVGCIFALLMALSACKPAYIDEERQVAKLARDKIDPEKLQAWAVNYLSSHSETEPINPTNLPPDVRSLYNYEPNAAVEKHVSNAIQGVCVSIDWGGGFGYRGLLIGNPTYRPPNRDNWLYIEEWIPGVYFYATKH